jgi:hypothetical protein
VKQAERKPIILGPNQGRSYDCGTMSALFRADGIETGDRSQVGSCRRP